MCFHSLKQCERKVPFFFFFFGIGNLIRQARAVSTLWVKQIEEISNNIPGEVVNKMICKETKRKLTNVKLKVEKGTRISSSCLKLKSFPVAFSFLYNPKRGSKCLQDGILFWGNFMCFLEHPFHWSSPLCLFSFNSRDFGMTIDSTQRPTLMYVVGYQEKWFFTLLLS